MKKAVRKFGYTWMYHYFYSLISRTVKQNSFGYIYYIYNLACVHTGMFSSFETTNDVI
jgi:hypothetical protein